MSVFFMIAVPSILILAMLLAFLAWSRWLTYQETIGLAAHGMYRDTAGASPSRTLRWGLILSGIGLALCIGLYPLTAQEFDDVLLGFGPIMLGGLLPLFVGLALILLWRIGRDEVQHSGAIGNGAASSGPARYVGEAPITDLSALATHDPEIDFDEVDERRSVT